MSELSNKFEGVNLDLIPQVEDTNYGMTPIEYNVILVPAKIEEKIGSVFITQDLQENMSDRTQVGRIIAMSPFAFNYEKWTKDTIQFKPKVGDIVSFAKYAGGEMAGFDGIMYRHCKDKDILGKINYSKGEE